MARPSTIKILWFLWACAFFSLEFYALGSPGIGDTLTEQVRPLLEYPIIFGAITVLWLWLGYHFLIYRRKQEANLATIEWPIPIIDSVTSERERLIREGLSILSLRLETVTAYADEPVVKEKKANTFLVKLALVKDILRQVAERFIPIAEHLVGAPTGSEKKALVKQEMLRVLKELEERLNLVPSSLEWAFWWLAKRGIDSIIEMVFHQLEVKGIVNAT